jgi:hypothetical protein
MRSEIGGMARDERLRDRFLGVRRRAMAAEPVFDGAWRGPAA